MRICDYCKKPIPLGTPETIHVSAMGMNVSKFFEDNFHSDSLDFCSLDCFTGFAGSMPPLNPSSRNKKK